MKQVLGILVWMALAAPVLAVQAPEGQEGFVPASQLSPADQLPAAPLLVTAYAFVWVAVFFYVWTLWRRLNSVEKDMQALKQQQAQRSDGR